MPNSFHWTNPDDEAPPKNYKRGVVQSPPAGKSLRMPLGIASDFTLERMKVYEDSETSEGFTPHHMRSRLEVCCIEHHVQLDGMTLHVASL
jgi:hypothetical protein